MKIKKKILIVITILILLALVLTIFFLFKPKQQNNINDNKKYCTESSRNSDVCIELYEPVCGFPTAKTYSNSCFACRERNVEYYTDREC